MNDKLCRLCLNEINDGDFQPIEDLEDTLNDLLLNLNLDISSEAVVCNLCANNLQRSSNFKKSACVNIEDSKYTLLDIKIDKLDSEEVDADINSARNLKICCLCRKSLGIWDCISLNETKENVFLVDMLHKHIPQWINYTTEFLTCYACLDSLRSFSNFIRNCLDVEEIIEKHIKIKGTNDKGHIELNDVQKLTFKPVTMYEAGCSNVTKMEGDDKYEENMIVETQTEIKREGEEIDYTDWKIKSEELDITLKEDDDCESFQVDSFSTNPAQTSTVKFGTYKARLDAGDYQCNDCLFRSNTKRSLKRHMLRHTNSSEITMYKCNSCSYETKFKWNLKTHISFKHYPSDSSIYHCATCTYTTENKKALKSHVKIHRIYKCEFCSFQTKYRTNLKVHLLSHQVSFRPFDCNKCLYVAKTLKRLTDHMMTHGADIAMFKCRLCPFQTKHMKSLQYHLQRHKDPAKATTYQCNMCLYKTEDKIDFKKHMLIHKDSSEKSLETHILPETICCSKDILSECCKCTEPCQLKAHKGYLGNVQQSGVSQGSPTEDMFRINMECPKNLRTYSRKRKPAAPQHSNGVLTAETGEI